MYLIQLVPMDIHRCRFVEYPPSAINALAFSHNSGSAGSNQPFRLAIGRANGDIEIWDPAKGAWIHETTLRGGKDRTVEGLAWTRDPDETDEDSYTTFGKLRLFSIGYSSAITEWDLITGLPLRQSTGSHSDVWCLSAQPAWKKPKSNTGKDTEPPRTGESRSQHLVAGCADGSLVLFSTEDDTLNFQKYIARPSKKKARALCLAWQDRNTIIAGFSDSAIRVYDVRNGSFIRNMSLAGGPRGAPKETLVWALACLPDGTVVSGDSNGEVCFWDRKSYGQLQRIKGHEADVLSLAAGNRSQSVFSGGMDRRTVMYSLGSSERWSKTTHRRFHNHDVKAMAPFENSKFSLLVSGGLDTYPIVVPVRDFGAEYHRKLPYTPQAPPVASGGRLFASWWNTQVTVWRIRAPNRELAPMDTYEEQPSHEVVARMALQGDEYITDASMSQRGDLLAVATVAEIRLFRLRARRRVGMKIKKLDVPKELTSHGARLIRLSPNCKWLAIIDSNSFVRLARIVQSPEEPQDYMVLQNVLPLRRLRRGRQTQNCLDGSWGSYHRTITRLTFSSDSRTLAVSDLDGYIDTWVLEGEEDLSAPAFIPAKRRKGSPASSSSSSGSESDSASDPDRDDSLRATRFPQSYNHWWHRNPAARLIPKMSSAPLVLSFQPATTDDYPTATTSTKHVPNGVTYPGRHQELQPEQQTAASDTLLIVTSTHEIHLVSALTGRLTPWSRRNAASSSSTNLPERFRVQRDRALGCIWDVGSRRRGERLWLYGCTWVCMFDLTQDLPQKRTAVNGAKRPDGDAAETTQEKPAAGKKRKRDDDDDDAATGATDALPSPRRNRHTTGTAGDAVRDDEIDFALPTRKLRKLDAEGNRARMEAPRPRRSPTSDRDSEEGDSEESEDDDAADDDEEEIPAAKTRRRKSTTPAEPDNAEDETTGEQPTTNGVVHRAHAAARSRRARPPPFYLTSQYRPILGIVPLRAEPRSGAGDGGAPHPRGGGRSGAGRGTEAEDVGDDDEPPAPEVALVERPFWELDLPARFAGAQEWEKGD